MSRVEQARAEIAGVSDAKVAVARVEEADVAVAGVEQAKVAAAGVQPANTDLVVTGKPKADVVVAGVRKSEVAAAGVGEADVEVADVCEPIVAATGVSGAQVVAAQVCPAEVSGAEVSRAEVDIAQVRAANISRTVVSVAHVPAAGVAQAEVQGRGPSRNRRFARCRRRRASQTLQRLGERLQRGGDRRSPSVVSRHDRHIEGPHLFIERLDGGDRRSILSEEVRQHERHQVRTVGRHQRRLHHRRSDRLELGRHGPGLGCCLPGPGRRGAEPLHIGGGRRCHRHRRRTLPRSGRQTRGHRPERDSGRTQFVRQPAPGDRRFQHRFRPGAGEYQSRVDLRWQHGKVHRSNLSQAASRPMAAQDIRPLAPTRKRLSS
uniref:Uncharacterized protein n=1 Tax=Mycobacterium riyadhense TaxID=486698 RepID=A0A653F1V5_9MYCO|nr:hypothetical protein BIN_B_05163 [Mycobacterium riyadhense]